MYSLRGLYYHGTKYYIRLKIITFRQKWNNLGFLRKDKTGNENYRKHALVKCLLVY